MRPCLGRADVPDCEVVHRENDDTGFELAQSLQNDEARIANVASTSGQSAPNDETHEEEFLEALRPVQSANANVGVKMLLKKMKESHSL